MMMLAVIARIGVEKVIINRGFVKIADFGFKNHSRSAPWFSPLTGGSRSENSAFRFGGAEDLERLSLRQAYEVAYLASNKSKKANKSSKDATKQAEDRNTPRKAKVTMKHDDNIEHSYFYDVDDGHGQLTSCVGTRWFRAPELLFGSTSYNMLIVIESIFSNVE
ncbi:Cyclin-dependent kinase F-1 [Castilleja foliolosa]|uniref:Cyclin-dependent kinase F-1 n=1 Tax=Castilleja foliolosa TaxID=1961234 RepID=A0ABD3ENZ9_9LAMI